MALYPPASLQLQPYHPNHLILFNDISIDLSNFSQLVVGTQGVLPTLSFVRLVSGILCCLTRTPMLWWSPFFQKIHIDDQKLTFSCKFSLCPDSVLDKFARAGLWLVVFFSFGILICVLISDPSFDMHLVDNGCRLINKIK